MFTSKEALYPIDISQAAIDTFQQALITEFDHALAAYLLLFKDPEIIVRLQHKKFTLFFAKMYKAFGMAVVFAFTLLFYLKSSEALPFLNWIKAIIGYGLLTYIAQYIPHHHNFSEDLVAASFLLLTSLSMIVTNTQSNVGKFLLLLTAIDKMLVKRFAVTVTSFYTLFVDSRDARWIPEYMQRNANFILQQSKLMGQKNSDVEPYKLDIQLTLPDTYRGQAVTLAQRCTDREKIKNQIQNLCSLEAIFIKALTALSWRDQLSLHIALKIFSNAKIAEEFTKIVLLEFYDNFASSDLETRQDYLYTVLLEHAILPTKFSADGQSTLSNAIDDAATYQMYVHPTKSVVLHPKHGFKVNKMDNVRVAEEEFTKLVKILSQCSMKLFTTQKNPQNTAGQSATEIAKVTPVFS